jgi:hypothetical protein
LSDSKLIPYLLPALPPLALLVALLPEATLRRDFQWTAVLTLFAGVALGVASFNWPALIGASSRAAVFLPLAMPLRPVAVLLALSGAFVLLQGRGGYTRNGVLLGVGWCLSWLLLVRAATAVAPIYSGIDLAAAFPAAAGDAPLYSIATYDQTLSFYLRRTATLVRYRGELDYGLNKAPQREIEDLDQFVGTWSSQPRAFAVMENGMFDELNRRGVAMRILGHNFGKVLVARP